MLCNHRLTTCMNCLCFILSFLFLNGMFHVSFTFSHIKLSRIAFGAVRHLKKFISTVEKYPSQRYSSRRSTDQFEQPRRSTDLFEVSRKSTDRREKSRHSTDRPEKLKNHSSHVDKLEKLKNQSSHVDKLEKLKNQSSAVDKLETLRVTFDQPERSRRSVDCHESPGNPSTTSWKEQGKVWTGWIEYGRVNT